MAGEFSWVPVEMTPAAAGLVLLGGELTVERLCFTGPLILIFSLAVIGVGALAVGAGLLALGP
ncbi:MAG: hypothetical protein ACQET7_15340 [Thermodesulfobacteriota bacterium]